IRCDGQVGVEVFDEPFQVPVFRVPALAVLFYALGDDLLRVAEDVVASVRALEDLAPLLVDDLTLLVHHVVVLDHVLAGIEVHALDLLLGPRNRPRHPGMLDGLHLEAVHQPSDAARGRTEDLHKVIFQRDEKAARAWVTLPAGSTAQLVVDAPALVALGADDVQPPYVGHTWTEHDVRASPGPVGRDGHGTRLTCLRNDLRLAFVLLRVEHVVPDASLLEHPRKPLGLLD